MKHPERKLNLIIGLIQQLDITEPKLIAQRDQLEQDAIQLQENLEQENS